MGLEIEITVRPAASGDLEAIGAIQAASRVASQWNPAQYLRYECTVALIGGRIAGFLVVRQTAPEEREVLNFAVDTAWRRKGVGRRLMEAEFARGAVTRFLEVRESNRPAIEFYQNAGFRPSGRRGSYYKDPNEDALIFVRP